VQSRRAIIWMQSRVCPASITVGVGRVELKLSVCGGRVCRFSQAEKMRCRRNSWTKSWHDARPMFQRWNMRSPKMQKVKVVS
jgi:hypothetical protein